MLGGAVYLDGSALDRYDVDPDGSRWPWYLAPFAIAHLGTVCYRFQRRRWLLERLEISTPAFHRRLEASDPPTSPAVGILLVLQFALVVSFVGGSRLFVPGVLLNVAIAPPLVWRDLAKVRTFHGVAWGWTGYLHPIASALPPMLLIYAIQRYEHLTYAMIVRLWDADPEDVAVDPSELSRLERFSEWLADSR